MRIIAIINQKGGCGKTTCSINLAAALAAEGQRTLLVDMDPQAHCALGLAVPESQVRHSTAEVLRSGMDGTLGVSDAVWQIARNFDLLPSTMSLAALEAQLHNVPDKDRRLGQVLSTVNDRYDFCVIDCPPSIGLLTFNALRAATDVIVPVETGYFSMEGAKKQHRTIEMLARRAGHNVEFSILPTMFDVRTKLACEILAEIKRHFQHHILPMVINFNAKLKEAASFGQPITEYDATCRGMQDFQSLALHLVANPPQHLTQEPQAEIEPEQPALSRAAELVERARVLATRTAEISAQLARDPDVASEGFAETPTLTRHTQINNLGGAALRNATEQPATEHSETLPAQESRLSHAQTPPTWQPEPTPTQSMPTQPTPSQPVQTTSTPMPPEQPAPDQPAQDEPAWPTPTVQNNTVQDNNAQDIHAQDINVQDINVQDMNAQPAQQEPASVLHVVDEPRLPLHALNGIGNGNGHGNANGQGDANTHAHPGTLQPQIADLHPKVAQLYGVRKTSQGLLFMQPLSEAGSIAIAGDFNGWNPTRTRLQRDEQLGVWQTLVNVEPGRYRYRLVVDGHWTQDPFNKTTETNPFGELNNIIEVV